MPKKKKVVKMHELDGSNRILRIGEVCQLTGLSPSSIYRLMREDKFPMSVQISTRNRGWWLKDLEEYLNRGGDPCQAASNRASTRI